MPESEIQALAQSLYDQDQDVPSATEEDYLVRRDIINMGIGFWEGFDGTEWVNLWTTLATDNTGADTTVATGDTQSDCPTSLVRIGKYIKLSSGTSKVLYERKTPQEAEELVANGSTAKFFWLSGKPGAYKINWNPEIPSEYNGYAISYQFYKKATLITTVSDVPDAPDHMFLVHYLLSWLFKTDDPGKSREQLDFANNLVGSMKRQNDISLMDSREDEMGDGFGI